MRLIVCEKQVAAKRIAEIISGGECVVEKKYKLPYYVFKNHLVAGLSGHVLRVDFPDECSSWSDVPLKNLALAELVYLDDKVRIIKLVKSLAKEADEVVIATDFDTEGESIGLEAVDIIKRVKDLPVKRMHYSSITKDEILSSYDELTGLDYNLAFAADARREIDLIWGAVLTRFLSLSTNRLGNSYLSAGRVQSPTLSLIVEREKERDKFKPVPYWQFPLKLKKDGLTFAARYVKKKVFDRELKDDLSALKPSEAVVKKVKVKKRVSKPPTPFNTTSFLREAASLGFSGVNAMRLAESLYLKGFISYPRTDNQVYPMTINPRKILDSFKGTSYELMLGFLKKRLKPTKGSKQTRDHPPIHPTAVKAEGLKKDERRVYDLIVRRFISTFSKDCVEEITRVRLDVDNHDFISRGYRVVSPGWRGVYTFSSRDDNVLPELAKDESLEVVSFKCVSKKTKPPRRYGHGTIIKAMNDLNLGTKSTRPAIIQKLVNRHYLFSSKSFEPTPIAMAVMDALDSYANLITEPSMTRELEEDMELIARGEASKEEVVSKSRELLLSALEVLLKHQDSIAERVHEGVRESRIVGPCLKCDKDMVIITSKRTGKRFVGCSGYPDCSNSYPLPQHGLVRITNSVCSDCGLRKIILIRKGKRPFSFCPNLECPSREDDD